MSTQNTSQASSLLYGPLPRRTYSYKRQTAESSHPEGLVEEVSPGLQIDSVRDLKNYHVAQVKKYRRLAHEGCEIVLVRGRRYVVRRPVR